MKRKSLVAVLLLVLVVMAVGCTKNIVQEASEDLLDLGQLETKAMQIRMNQSSEDLHRSLHQMAPVFAKALQEDKSLRNLLGAEIGKKFDGDYDVLYDMISSKLTKDGQNVQGKLLRAARRGNLELSADTLTHSVPYFNIAIPVNFEQWGTYDGPIYVIPLRYDVDDQEIETVVGYDANGNTKTFSTATPPEFPVVVLGINERINMLKRKQQMDQQIVDQGDQAGVQVTAVTHEENLRGLVVQGSYDAWPRGNPELYLLYTAGYDELAVRIDYPDVDVEGVWYSFNQKIFDFAKSPNHAYWYVEAWDEDSTDYYPYVASSSFTYDNVTYNIRGAYETAPGDDKIGSGLINSNRILSAYGWNEYKMGGLGIRLNYREY